MTKTVTIQCNVGDCWANKNDVFGDGSAGYLYVIDDPSASNSNVKTWIPFTVPLRRVTIEQAYIKFTPSANGSNSGNLLFQCEDVTNPSTPTTGADLNGRVLTTFSSSQSMQTFTLDSENTYQIDNPVTEVLDRVDWQAGSVLAVVIQDDGIGDVTRQIYSYEGDASKRARLTINYTEYFNNISYFY